MATLVGLFGIAVSMAAIFAAARFPARRTRLESLAGALFVASVALIGLNFPMT